MLIPEREEDNQQERKRKKPKSEAKAVKETGSHEFSTIIFLLYKGGGDRVWLVGSPIHIFNFFFPFQDLFVSIHCRLHNRREKPEKEKGNLPSFFVFLLSYSLSSPFTLPPCGEAEPPRSKQI